jgi:hypothetical protein
MVFLDANPVIYLVEQPTNLMCEKLEVGYTLWEGAQA